MKFLENNSDQSLSLALTPLVDIIFLLIIFFLVSSTFEKGEKNLGIQLPSTQGKDNTKSESITWVFNIKMDGRFYFEDKRISQKQMESMLKNNRSRRNQIQAILRGDERVAYGIIAKLIGLFNQYGYKKVAFKVTSDTNPQTVDKS